MKLDHTENIKEIRKTIKAKYPAKDGWKFSIRLRNYNSYNVEVLQAPIKAYSADLTWNSNYGHYTPEFREIIKSLYAILNSKQERYETDEPCPDYTIYSYYTNVSVDRGI